MKKAQMNISHSRFILFKLKIFSEIVTTYCIFTSMQLVPLLVLAPALPVVSLRELSPELLLIVTAIGKETYASLSIIISCHSSRPIGSKISIY